MFACLSNSGLLLDSRSMFKKGRTHTHASFICPSFSEEITGALIRVRSTSERSQTHLSLQSTELFSLIQPLTRVSTSPSLFHWYPSQHSVIWRRGQPSWIKGTVPQSKIYKEFGSPARTSRRKEKEKGLEIWRNSPKHIANALKWKEADLSKSHLTKFWQTWQPWVHLS